mgnify:CR=1 FL=1
MKLNFEIEKIKKSELRIQKSLRKLSVLFG